MSDKVTWYFKVDERAGWAYDESGVSAPCLLAIKIGFNKGVPIDCLESVQNEREYTAKKCGAGLLGISEEFLSSISEDEYVESVEEDDNVVGYCNECGAKVFTHDEITDVERVYECSECQHPNGSSDLWDIRPDYLRECNEFEGDIMD